MKDFENKLLKRREVEFSIESEKNPGLVFSAERVAEHFKAEIGRVAVKRIVSGFGERKFLVEAFIYKSEDEKNRIEPRIKIKKKEGENK